MIYLRTHFSDFLDDEAHYQGVSRTTIARWRRAGRYGHMVFDMRPQRSTASGTTLKLKTMRAGRKWTCDWSLVDWSQSTRAIMEQTGACKSAVNWNRRRLGL